MTKRKCDIDDPIVDEDGVNVSRMAYERQHGLVRNIFSSLWKHGPLGTIKRINEYMQSLFDKFPACLKIFISIDKFLFIVQRYLDSGFDLRYNYDTSGVIHLKELTIKSKNIKEGIWYEPISVKVFKQLMNLLTIEFSKFVFIDFGSGKGRALLLAAEYGYKKIIGVEFAKELHFVATKNVMVAERYARRPGNIVTVCMDAAEFPIPNESLVLFFYSPFKGQTMEQVLMNVKKSYAMKPREIVILFYGSNPETIKLLRSTEFHCSELELRSDWSRFTQYRCFLLTSQKQTIESRKC